MNPNTRSATPGICLRPILLALCISTPIGLSSSVVMAQGAPTSGTKASASTELHHFNIPAHPLGEALILFGQQSGLQVTSDSKLVEGKQASPVNGNLPPEQALSQLLAGTGLRYQINGGMVSLVAGGGATTLPPVKVSGSSIDESAYGPVDGYIAKHSAAGTKTDTPIIETPQSISVVSRQEMELRAVVDVGEAVSYNAGVFAGIFGDNRLFGGNNIQIRGYGGNGTAGGSFNEYLDGLKLQPSGYIESNLDPWLLERVEVLKGPASVLFGQTQPGGIVNMVSKRPHEDMTNKLRVGTGNHDKASLAFDLGGQLTDAWQFRVVGLGIDGETQQNPSDRKRQLLAPSLRWSNDTTDLTLLAHYQHDDINASVLNTVPKDAVFSNPNGRLPLDFRVGDPGFEFWDRKTWSVGYLFSHRLSDALTFRQNLRFTNNKQDSQWTYRGSLENDLRTLNRTALAPSEDADTLSVDNQLQWKTTSGQVEHTLLMGLDYQDFSGISLAFGGTAPSIDLFDPAYNQAVIAPSTAWRDDETDRKLLGIYLQDQIKIGDLSLLIGGRYDDAEISTKDNLGMSTVEETDHDFTSRIGIIYNFANGLAPYASYAESFEPVSGRSFDGSRFDPMEGKQYEVGVKYQPAGTDHLFTLAAFDLTQENMTTADPDNTGFSIQTGEVQTRGVELEGKLNVNNNLNVSAAYTYLNDEIKRSNNGDEGKQRAAIPEQTASLWVNYLFSEYAFSGMDIGMGVRYIGETQGNNENTFAVPSYTLVDLAVHYDLGRSIFGMEGWQASLNVSNLFDKYYIASCSRDRNCYLGLERSIQASVKYTW